MGLKVKNNHFIMQAPKLALIQVKENQICLHNDLGE